VTFKVLIVDDSVAVQETLRDVVDSVPGFEVVGYATSEAEATELLHFHGGRIDLVLLDLLIKDGSGFNLISRASGEPKARVVVVSGYVTPGVATRCIALGADAAYTKSDAPSLIAYLENFARPAAAA
jgi:DNA-binding NarL/FixJ family response regulator